jgi:hypothetical protein
LEVGAYERCRSRAHLGRIGLEGYALRKVADADPFRVTPGKYQDANLGRLAEACGNSLGGQTLPLALPFPPSI